MKCLSWPPWIGVPITQRPSRTVTLVATLATLIESLSASRPEGHGLKTQQQHKVETMVGDQSTKFRTQFPNVGRGRLSSFSHLVLITRFDIVWSDAHSINVRRTSFIMLNFRGYTFSIFVVKLRWIIVRPGGVHVCTRISPHRSALAPRRHAMISIATWNIRCWSCLTQPLTIWLGSLWYGTVSPATRGCDSYFLPQNGLDNSRPV